MRFLLPAARSHKACKPAGPGTQLCCDPNAAPGTRNRELLNKLPLREPVPAESVIQPEPGAAVKQPCLPEYAITGALWMVQFEPCTGGNTMAILTQFTKDRRVCSMKTCTWLSIDSSSWFCSPHFGQR